MASRAGLLKPAVRQEMKARLMLYGPSGSGKTRSALAIATGLANGGSIALIDTEVGSSTTYAEDFDFDYIPWEPPYNPVELGETVAELAQRNAVVVVDSLSHFWEGEGGVLEKAGGDFRGWKDATPMQEEMVRQFLRCGAHLIICARSKQSYEMSQGNGGKAKVEKVGLAPIQRPGFEYELNVSLRIDMQHNLEVDKTRCPVLADRVFRPGRGPQEFADIYGQWLASGEPVADAEIVKDLLKRLEALPKEDGTRAKAKQEFVMVIGRPELLRESQVKPAEALVTKWEKEVADAPVQNNITELRAGAEEA